MPIRLNTHRNCGSGMQKCILDVIQVVQINVIEDDGDKHAFVIAEKACV